MVNYYLFIEAKFRSEVIERILRVVRHRGFELCELKMTRCNSDKNNNVNIYLTVISDRSIHLLCAQLNKLIDIVCVEIQ